MMLLTASMSVIGVPLVDAVRFGKRDLLVHQFI